MLYYRHHIGDYVRDTAHLSLLEHGAYRLLIDLYYQHEGFGTKTKSERSLTAAMPIEKSIEQICRLCRPRSPGERSAIKRMLLEFFTYDSKGWHHKRCDREIQALLKNSEVARQKASKRWDAAASRQHTQGNASRYPLSNTALDLDLNRITRPPKDDQERLIKPEEGKTVKRIPPTEDQAAIEKNRRIAQAMLEGNIAKAQAIREGLE